MIKLTSLQDEDIFIRPDIIVLIQQLPEEHNFPSRAVIKTESGKIIAVKEKASIIALLIDNDSKKPEIVYSKILQRFSERLKNPKVLTHPEEILGRNYKEVLNFWLILDDLSEEQLRVIEDRHDAFINENHSKWSKATDLACEASWEVVGEHYTYYAGYAALDVTNSYAACWATRELIGGVENPVFLKMFNNL